LLIALAGTASSRAWRAPHAPDGRDDAMVIALLKPLGKRFVALALSAGRCILFQIARLDARPLHLRRVHRDA
jgi:hypothetical protein